MATPEDPLRALAERGVLHVDPDAQYWSNNFVHPSGEHLEKLATTPLAQRWENVTDNMLRVEPASTYQNFGSSNMTAEHPWIQNLAPDTPFYRPKDDAVPTNLGFNHLIDELSNAINPESGLPRHLQFPAERLAKVSVPQAVERVASINEWRAAQKAIADQAKANNAATVLHKEYPEQGMKWVELKAPESLEGWERTSSGDWLRPGQQVEIDEAGNFINPAKQALQDALKYEGDTMGHCVGGYCEDVASGHSRIYSLRDAKGQPHVTVEVQKGYREPRFDAPEPVQEKWNADAHREAELSGLTDEEDIRDYVMDRISDYADQWNSSQPKEIPRIVQIKGKQNLIPNPEYLPFVQDFVKSGKWSDVGDLQNAGLRRGQDVFNELEKQKLQEAGHNVNEYLSPEEIADLQSKFGQRFAQGGSVCPNKIETPEQLRAIIRDIQSRY